MGRGGHYEIDKILVSIYEGEVIQDGHPHAETKFPDFSLTIP